MKKIILYILLSLVVFSCADPFEDNITPAYTRYPAATWLRMESRFSLWTGLLVHTNLFNTMNLGANYTCFVPDDGAMGRYLQKKGVSKISDLPLEEARYLVKYHIIAGKVYSQSQFDNGVIPDTTATGDFLSIVIREGGLNAIYVNDEARISQLDVEVTNGIIHVLEDVLTPVTQTIWGKMNQQGYSVMRDAVERTGYSGLLNSTTVTEINPGTGMAIQSKKYFTFFAVPDEIFRSKGINQLSDLLVMLGESDTDYTNPDNELNRFVAYHILNQQLDFDMLASFPENVTSKNIATLAENQLINVSETGKELFLNYSKESGTHISIVDDNISTKNGVIHTISDLMLIATPPVTTVTWELTDYADIASLVSNIYRKSGVSATTFRYFDPGEITTLTWSAIPSSKNGNSVAYLIANKNDATRYEMLNYDCLYLELGLYGWIDLKTPAIIKGNYQIKVTCYSMASSKKSGKFMIILDNEYVGGEIATHGVSTTKTQIVTTTAGSVTFPQTTTHKVRILAGDNSGIYIDRIVFEPVK